MALVEQSYNGRGSTMADSSTVRVSPSTNGMSKLSQMQARFQQKQLQEKEQKLLRLYESQQLRAFQRVGRGSAGSSSVSSTSSTTSSSSLGNGKVRQLFDERRTQGTKATRGAGWDRSYPLEPLDNARTRQNGHQRITRGASLDRINIEPVKKAVSRSKSQIRPGNLLNGDHLDRRFRRPEYDYPDEDYNYSQDDLNSSYYRDNNYNRLHNQNNRDIEPLFTKSRPYQSEYEEQALGNGEVFDQSQLFKKLTNVGGILLMKERTMNEDRYKTYNAGSRRVGPGATVAAKQPLATRRENVASPPSTKTVAKPAPKSQFGSNVSPANGLPGQRTNVPKGPSQLSPPARSPTQVTKRPTAPPAMAASSAARSNPPSARGNASNTAVATAKPAGARSTVRGGPPAVNLDLKECRICGRNFASDRIEMHQQICAKTGQKKRKVFDPLKQRIQGTEAEAFVRMGKKAPPKPVKKQDWRRKHEDFINTIRAAKEMQAHVAAGGKLSDLPPPPPSDYSDYVQCPHCGRKFNETAAERHIPHCANMQHNKAKPAPKGATMKKR